MFECLVGNNPITIGHFNVNLALQNMQALIKICMDLNVFENAKHTIALICRFRSGSAYGWIISFI